LVVGASSRQWHSGLEYGFFDLRGCNTSTIFDFHGGRGFQTLFPCLAIDASRTSSATSHQASYLVFSSPQNSLIHIPPEKITPIRFGRWQTSGGTRRCLACRDAKLCAAVAMIVAVQSVRRTPHAHARASGRTETARSDDALSLLGALG